MRPPFTTPAIVTEIERIQRFVPPENEVDKLLMQAIASGRRCRGRSIAKRPGVMPSLEAALRLSPDPTVKRELTELLARLNERSRRVK